MGFIPFPRVLELCEMQSVSSRNWTCVAVSKSCIYELNFWSSFDDYFFIYRCHSYWWVAVVSVLYNMILAIDLWGSAAQHMVKYSVDFLSDSSALLNICQTAYHSLNIYWLIWLVLYSPPSEIVTQWQVGSG